MRSSPKEPSTSYNAEPKKEKGKEFVPGDSVHCLVNFLCLVVLREAHTQKDVFSEKSHHLLGCPAWELSGMGLLQFKQGTFFQVILEAVQIRALIIGVGLPVYS